MLQSYVGFLPTKNPKGKPKMGKSCIDTLPSKNIKIKTNEYKKDQKRKIPSGTLRIQSFV